MSELKPTIIYSGSRLAPSIAVMEHGDFKDWILAKHPDGQWVSLGKLPDAYTRTPDTSVKVDVELFEPSYMIYFEDSERENEYFAGNGAKECALKRYEQIGASWNARLFRECKRNWQQPALQAPRSDTSAVVENTSLLEYEDALERASAVELVRELVEAIKKNKNVIDDGCRWAGSFDNMGVHQEYQYARRVAVDILTKAEQWLKNN